MNGGPVIQLDWDSRHFGFGVAKIERNCLTGEDLENALSFCRSQSIRCLYFLADSNDVESCTSAVEAGFRLVDIRVDLDRRDPGLRAQATDDQPADVATEDDLPALLGLARSAFTESRFYRDENFPPGKAAELFALWTEKGVREREYFTVMHRYEGRPAGFLTGRAASERGGSIELLAVSQTLRGKGIGAELLTASLVEFNRRHCQVVSVATQGSNTAAQRLYQAHGFRTRSVRLWFHLWI